MAKNTVYFFNPTCEMAIANGSFSYMPPALLQQMENDLAILPFLMANENDFVLTDKKPSETFTERIAEAGFKFPTFCSLNELGNRNPAEIDSIQPWGWSPATHYKFRNLKDQCGVEFKNSPVFNWIPQHRLLYERGTALDVLNRLLDNEPSEFFVDRNCTGKKVTNTDAISQLLQKHPAIVVKAPLSSSGRGIQIIRQKTLNQPNREWISGILKQQKYVIAEPWLDKLLDLSFQFKIDRTNGLKYLGYTVFETNSNGQYQSTLIRPALKNLIPDVDEREIKALILETSEKLERALKNSVYSRFYEGFLGVDALIFKQEDKFKIQPCVEINCRMNMGILAMFCEKQLHQRASGKFSIFYGKSGNYRNLANKQSAFFDLKLKNEKIFSGFISLTEPHPEQKFGAYLFLGDSR